MTIAWLNLNDWSYPAWNRYVLELMNLPTKWIEMNWNKTKWFPIIYLLFSKKKWFFWRGFEEWKVVSSSFFVFFPLYFQLFTCFSSKFKIQFTSLRSSLVQVRIYFKQDRINHLNLVTLLSYRHGTLKDHSTRHQSWERKIWQRW